MKVIFLFLILGLSACEKETSPAEPSSKQETAVSTETSQSKNNPEETPSIKKEPSLEQILAAQEDGVKSRYLYRNPKETLNFFDVRPGMSVVEALPGGGWYSKILLPYLGTNGTLIGIDYDLDMWPHFAFTDTEFINKRQSWPQTWPNEMREHFPEEDIAEVKAYTFASAPQALNGKVDRVLFIRALHNLSRFQKHAPFLKRALETSYRLLKKDGLIGVVQHQVDESYSNEWADGSRGYLKKSTLIQFFKDAGFELVAESAINENTLDQPKEDDIVWRLPPSYSTSQSNEELKKPFTEIGESNRMTLVFKKI